MVKGLLQELTRHVGSCHDSSAAIEHDSKDLDKIHDYTSCIVNCVAGYENTQRGVRAITKFKSKS